MKGLLSIETRHKPIVFLFVTLQKVSFRLETFRLRNTNRFWKFCIHTNTKRLSVVFIRKSRGFLLNQFSFSQVYLFAFMPEYLRLNPFNNFPEASFKQL